MQKRIYNADISSANLKSAKRVCRQTFGFCLVFWLALFSNKTLFAADWSAAEEQLARKIVAVMGPGTVSLTADNRSSLGRRDSDLVQNGVRSALEQLGIHLAKSEQAAATVNLTLSQNEASYVWVATIRQGAADSAVVMVSVPRSGRSSTAYESMPITLRKIPLWTQDERILDVAVLEESGTPSRIAVLDADKVSVYRLQNGKWEAEQTLQISHTTPWPLDMRGRLVPAMDHSVSAYLPGAICRINVVAVLLNMTCRPSDDLWPIVSAAMSSPVFPSAGNSPTPQSAVPPLAGFFTSTRNYFTGVVSPAIGKFSTVPKFYSAAFVAREKYTLWMFAAIDGKVHLLDGMNDQPSNFSWGSDIAGLKTACGSGSQVLATTAGDQAQDSVRAYEFPDRDPVAVSAAVDLPGPLSALWTEGRGDTAVAIARNRDTGSYEAFRLVLACGQ